jgi:multidrug efflux pump subunit AcrB
LIPLKIEGYGLSFDQVIANFTENNQLIPAGNIEMGTGRFAIKVPGFRKHSILCSFHCNHQDAIIRLKDVAKFGPRFGKLLRCWTVSCFSRNFKTDR